MTIILINRSWWRDDGAAAARAARFREALRVIFTFNYKLDAAFINRVRIMGRLSVREEYGAEHQRD